MCGFIAQLVEHRTGLAEVTGSNPVEALNFFRLHLSNCLNWKIYCDEALIFFRLPLFNCLNWKIYCDDHSSLSSTTAVHMLIISYILHIISLLKGRYELN